MLVFVEHLGDQHLELDKLALVDSRRRQGTRFPFDRTPGFEELERTNVRRPSLAARWFLVQDINARAGTHIHQAVELKGNDCLPDGGTRNGESLGKVPFGGEALTHFVSAYGNVACK